ncbi:Stemmadenine O-acetyltransferase [Linum perenne]
MGSLRVEMVSIERIKPSTPTPQHLRIHKLTIFDQTAPSVYVPFCLFYSSSVYCSLHQRTSFVDSLKASLADTLNLYYPLAGRYKDAFSVECNDHGVDFVHANVVGVHLSDALHQPDEDRLLPLLPCRPQGMNIDSNGELVLLGAQVNFFECGGMALGVCIWHGLTDACTLACFLRTWTQFNSRAAGDHRILKTDVVQDFTSLFPPRDLSRYEEVVKKFKATVTTPDSRIKRFVFEADKIETLREKMYTHWNQRPSRVLTVSSVIWAAAINIARRRRAKYEGGENTSYHHIASMTTNLRPRLNPALPETVMGNIIQIPVFAKWESTSTTDEDEDEEEGKYYKELAEKLKESVNKVMDESVRKTVGSEGILEVVKYFVEEYGKGNLMAISSWCRFPFYDMDFGLGNPLWVSFFTMCYNLCVLIDAPDGNGIEAWITLSNNDMSMFLNDSAIRRYTK